VIITSFTIENWGCISRVEIKDLSSGINVISAPNMSGKTTVAQALKLSLLEYKYNTSKIRKHIPWASPDAVPAVTAEFSAHGRAYRMAKVFSKKAGGYSELVLINENGAEQKIAGSGEVTEKVREILGMNSLGAGLPQLFWIPQGFIALPDVDEDLGHSLRSVLGQIHTTDHDLRVLDLLQKKVAAWFKPADFKNRNFYENGALREKSLGAGCALKDLSDQILEQQNALGEIEQKFEQTEKLAAELLQIRHEHGVTLAQIAEAETRLQDLRAQEHNIAAKKTLLADLQHRLNDLEQQRDRLQQALAGFQALDREIQETGAQLEALRVEIEAAGNFATQRHARRDLAKQNKTEAIEKQKSLARRRDLLDAKKAVLHNNAEAADIQAVRNKAESLAAEIKELREKLAAIVAPDKQSGAKIQSLLQERETLAAEIKAAEIQVSVEAESAFSAEFRIDGRDPETVAATPGDPLTKSVRRRAVVRIPGTGSVRIQRGGDSHGMDTLESALERNSASLRTLLAPLDVDPALPQTQIIGEIESRTITRQALGSKLKSLIQERDSLLERGEHNLAARLTQLHNDTAAQCAAFPELHATAPDRDSLAAEQQAFDTDKKAVDTEAEAANAEYEQAAHAAEAADKTLQALIDQKNTISVRLDQKQQWRATEYSGKFGSAADLAKLLQNNKQEIATVREQLQSNALTDQEQNLSTRMEQEQAALRSKTQRERDLGENRTRIQTLLMETDGLHGRRNTIEETLQALRREHARLEISIKAHCLLLCTIEQVRDADVDKTLLPVTQKLTAWLGAMDGAERKQVVFGPDLKPQGITTRGGLQDNIQEATSLGEFEQLTLLIRLAYGSVAAGAERQAVILDDPLAHTDRFRLMRLLPILEDAAAHNLQFIIFTCEPARFDHLRAQNHIPLQACAP
jgi:DNA repair exonuclease SbcCD ATPase subunit